MILLLEIALLFLVLRFSGRYGGCLRATRRTSAATRLPPLLLGGFQSRHNHLHIDKRDGKVNGGDEQRQRSGRDCGGNGEQRKDHASEYRYCPAERNME